MGSSRYLTVVNGRRTEAGYGVQGTCADKACPRSVSRGLDNLCGGTPDNPHGCGNWFCNDHLEIPDAGVAAEQLCTACRRRAALDPALVAVATAAVADRNGGAAGPDSPEDIALRVLAAALPVLRRQIQEAIGPSPDDALRSRAYLEGFSDAGIQLAEVLGLAPAVAVAALDGTSAVHGGLAAMSRR